MFGKYIVLLVRALEKLPFFNYLNRLAYYIRRPDIRNNSATVEQFEHSLLDIVNALGLVVIVVSSLVLMSNDNSYLNAVKVFNPIYMSLTYLSYGVVFSVCVAATICLLTHTSFFDVREPKPVVFYSIFCHSLRFYAAIGLFLGLLMVHAVGKILYSGLTLEQSFVGWFFSIYVIITIIWFPVRLYILPLFRYVQLRRSKSLGGAMIIGAVLLGINMNQILPKEFSSKLVIHSEICTFFKSGALYKSGDQLQKSQLESVFCSVETS